MALQMSGQKIQLGQVWKKVGTEETFLVTKLYNEALTTIAVLRPTGAATSSILRVRVERRGDHQGMPGYEMAQGGETH
jgi:hypothetical protein